MDLGKKDTIYCVLSYVHYINLLSLEKKLEK